MATRGLDPSGLGTGGTGPARPDDAVGQDLTACDREPIHIPGSIQPHGLLLIADAATLAVVAGAGDIEGMLAEDWLGRTLCDLLDQDVRALVDGSPAGTIVASPIVTPDGRYDVALHRSGDDVLVELEPAGDAPLGTAQMLASLDTIVTSFERATSLQSMCERAATAFRSLTGFDRVMVYRFLDDDAGVVVAEARDAGEGTFLNHHFPASDIPRQARALYVRNRARVIPDIDYTPAPLRPHGYAGVDLSDVAVRSVSPIHLQYLANMGVAGSASISIVKDGLLWGLIACHALTPRRLPRDIRAAATALAGALARQITAKEEAEGYRERLRLRGEEDAVMASVGPDASLRETFPQVGDALCRMMAADAFALVDRGNVQTVGTCPPDDLCTMLAAWAQGRSPGQPLATHHLQSLRPDLADISARASGLLVLPLADDEGVLLWFRAEQIEEVEWAGNPHKAVAFDPAATLTPRTSFESWSQAVCGRSRRWTLGEIEAAHRLRRTLHHAQVARTMRTLNRDLQRTVAEKDAALAQKDVLMREVDHRVQNSLQLVAAFLSLQARGADPAIADQLREARSRISAVALVHRRLYHGNQIETIDLSRYLDELAADLRSSLGEEWARGMRVSLAPILVPTDRAVNVGLVMAELVINATKYAYAGGAGPIEVALEQHRNRLRLIVADQGGGVTGTRTGFGSRMMDAVVTRLGGTIELMDNQPGVRAVLTAPIEDEG